ncbi:hypothetical protein G6O69_19220 [Pseudenhygromyxa sp. WMMC2535]|uniref:RCC1 domain-containing protein n=1 Tax=Pseudenhygromyxa sp. WMMC2535 TaxID=2712867 RepID=UPI00159629F3|nr:hypothetical protein [Pseudenhygromyxa sp. WMMC2535]NVB39984.1 hypothetical protein [Pseudenhygromyxa sp. WMMC2535]
MHLSKAGCGLVVATFLVTSACTDDGGEADTDEMGSESSADETDDTSAETDSSSDDTDEGSETDTDTSSDDTDEGSETDTGTDTDTDTGEDTGTDTEGELCGNGVLDEGEACDDGNADETDACTTLCQAPTCDDGILSGDESDLDCGGSCAGCLTGQACEAASDCTSGACEESLCTLAAHVATGNNHTCAVLSGGAVRCWGHGFDGALGYGNTTTIGDDETPAEVGDVALGGLAIDVSAGGFHSCARLDDGGLRCWGSADYGQLGYGNTLAIGEGLTPDWAGDVPVGGPVIDITAGSTHTCALLEGGSVRCWGRSLSGQLGYANTLSVGDDETPEEIGDVDVGGVVTQIAAGTTHTCALLEGGGVRCWGSASQGKLGYANSQSIGDDETPAEAGDVQLGGAAVQVVAGGNHTCALLEGGAVRCWGRGGFGATGYGDGENIGDDETPASAGDVPIGGTAVQLTAGYQHTCALMSGGAVRCWGNGGQGRLGYANEAVIGDDETPDTMGDVDLGEGAVAVEVAAGTYHTCALLTDDNLLCWGWGSNGRLGYGNTENIGDDETPASAGPVSYQ